MKKDFVMQYCPKCHKPIYENTPIKEYVADCSYCNEKEFKIFLVHKRCLEVSK